MKIRFKIILVLIFFLFSLVGCLEQEGKYCTNAGKDTTAEFGIDCRFHLIQGYTYEGVWTNRLHVLIDREKDVDLMTPVYSYDLTNEYGYFLGEALFVMIDLKTNRITTFTSKEELESKRKNIFDELLKQKNKNINAIEKV